MWKSICLYNALWNYFFSHGFALHAAIFAAFFCCSFLCHLSCSDLLSIKLIWCSTHKSICRPLSQHRQTQCQKWHSSHRSKHQKCRYVCIFISPCLCGFVRYFAAQCAFVYPFAVIYLIRYDSLHLSKLFNIFFFVRWQNGLLQIEALRKYTPTFSCPMELSVDVLLNDLFISFDFFRCFMSWSSFSSWSFIVLISSSPSPPSSAFAFRYSS